MYFNDPVLITSVNSYFERQIFSSKTEYPNTQLHWAAFNDFMFMNTVG